MFAIFCLKTKEKLKGFTKPYNKISQRKKCAGHVPKCYLQTFMFISKKKI
jgi:hypothetical protein